MKINVLLAIAFLSFIAYANLDHLHGMIGTTLRDGGLGCACHGVNPTSSVNVWIEGPDSLLRNETALYKLLITGGPAVAGGLNIASYIGTLASVDTLTQELLGELTHTSPNPSFNDTVSWNFSYTAPDSLTSDTLYSVGNSVNGNGNPTQDQWNFGENFVIHIIDNLVNTEIENLKPEDFVLYQNYPNPFNPSTKIKFTLTPSLSLRERVSEGRVRAVLKVYDILGNEIAVLVNEELASGEYEVEFSLESNIQHPASGIYFYRLSSGSFSETKKMLLLK
jgi:Secretion system C-terminal sorting domain